MIDCHAHFFDPDRPEGIVWPSRSAPFYGRKLIEQYREDFLERAPNGVIVVETSRRDIDDDWLAKLANENALIAGYVANLQPDKPEFPRRLEAHLAHRKFKGLRLRPIELFGLGSDQTHATCKALGESEKVLELGAKTAIRLPDIFRLANAHPTLSIVVDHAGHPDLTLADGDLVWEEQIASNALPRNIWWKLTPDLGGPREASHRFPEALSRCLMHIAKHVTPDRILLGSNWPVSSAQLWKAMHGAVACHMPGLDEGAVANAVEVYGLRPDLD